MHYLALLKAQISLQLGKVSVQIMEFQFLQCTRTHTDYTAKSLSDTVLSLDMHGCFMTTKYLCACLKRYHANLSLKQGYALSTVT